MFLLGINLLLELVMGSISKHNCFRRTCSRLPLLNCILRWGEGGLHAFTALFMTFYPRSFTTELSFRFLVASLHNIFHLL